MTQRKHWKLSGAAKDENPELFHELPAAELWDSAFATWTSESRHLLVASKLMSAVCNILNLIPRQKCQWTDWLFSPNIPNLYTSGCDGLRTSPDNGTVFISARHNDKIRGSRAAVAFTSLNLPIHAPTQFLFYFPHSARTSPQWGWIFWLPSTPPPFSSPIHWKFLSSILL